MVWKWILFLTLWAWLYLLFKTWQKRRLRVEQRVRSLRQQGTLSDETFRVNLQILGQALQRTRRTLGKGIRRWLSSAQHKKRQREILKSLPDVLDLLTISVEAGLGFDQALTKVVEKAKGPLAEELAKTLQEIQYGKNRRDALRDLSTRLQVDALTQLVNALLQADRLGIGIAQVLRVQAEDLRMRRRQYAEERAMKAPVKLLFPLIFFVFPSLFVILLGPAAINIFTTLMK